jgi:hypothetical protein
MIDPHVKSEIESPSLAYLPVGLACRAKDGSNDLRLEVAETALAD